MKSHNMTVLSKIQKAKNQQIPLLAILLDPDKTDAYTAALPHIQSADLIFVGGSTGFHSESCIQQLRKYTNSPIVLFPGNISQFSSEADALLYLTLLNAQSPDILINPHIQVAKEVLFSGIESIPMGYILIDGHKQSSVEIASKCQPIAQDDMDKILSTAIAGQLLGKELVYLEAGSGARTPISPDIIQTVHKHLQIPIIVGGGITSPQLMIQAFRAGADVVVIGNHFEKISR